VASAYQEWKRKLGETRPWDALNPLAPKVEDDEAYRRLDICEECPSLLKMTHQCKECGCFMKLKVKLEKASCPLGKW
jgi:hypothetical protein